MHRLLCALVLLILLPLAPVHADEPRVVAAKAVAGADGAWRFDVTVRHNDTGWDHYADGWEILDGAGKVLARRVLLHPHETEQPFTRSLTGVRLPAGLARVVLRAHDKVHGYGSVTVTVDLAKGGS